MGADLSKKRKSTGLLLLSKARRIQIVNFHFYSLCSAFFFSLLRVQSVLMAHARSYYKQCIQALHEKRLVHIRETIFVT